MYMRHAVPCEDDCCPCDSFLPFGAAFEDVVGLPFGATFEDIVGLPFDAAFEDVVGLSFVAALAVDLAEGDGLEWGVSDCRGSVVCDEGWSDRERAETDEDFTGDEGNEELLRSDDWEDDFVGFFLLLALGASVHRVYLCL